MQIRPIEEKEALINELEANGYEYTVHEDPDGGRVRVSYKCPSADRMAKNGEPVLYDYVACFERPMFNDTVRSKLEDASFPQHFINEIMRDDDLIETEAIQSSREIVANFPISAVFIGDTDIGKTFGSVWIAYQLFRQRKIYKAQFVRATELNKQRAETGFLGAGSNWDFWFDKKTDYLVLDDLGTESMVLNIHSENQDKQGLVWELIDFRYSNKFPTVITTNISIEGLKQRYGERLVSRLDRWGIVRRFKEAADDE